MLPREDASRYIGVTVAAMASWAHTGRYRDIIPPARIGKKAYYRRCDLDKWLESRFSPTAK
jgi:hypothetical protein